MAACGVVAERLAKALAGEHKRPLHDQLPHPYGRRILPRVDRADPSRHGADRESALAPLLSEAIERCRRVGLLLKMADEHRGILDCLARALADVDRDRVGGVADQTDAAL